jgi:cell wall assembly regulator SMI1
MSAEGKVRRIFIAAGVAILVLVVAAVALIRLNWPALLSSFYPTLSPDEMYPPAPAMPPVVAAPVDDLLAKYEAFLKAKAPSVLAALQPGLSDAEIDKLEAAHSIQLTSDLRALYRWRNGTPRSANLDAFPNHEFVPLDVALANRDDVRKQVKTQTPEQQQVDAAFAGHRDAWLGLIVDLAGDGHFFDPTRSESEGSFFYCFNEDGSYIFYPAFRNYLAAVVDGEKVGIFVAGPRGVDTADFVKAQALWERFGAAPER